MQLNLDMGSVFVPKLVSDILVEVSMIHDFPRKSSKLDFYVLSMEEEMRKIDAFKRELPYCMHLLTNAIETLKKESLKWKGNETAPAMEEFIPLRTDSISEKEGRARLSNDISEKRNWMSSVQLWTTPIQYETNLDTRNQGSILSLRSRDREEEASGLVRQLDGWNFKNKGGAFVPFKRPSVATVQGEKRGVPVHGLSLASPVAEVESLDLNMKEAWACDSVTPRPPQPNPQKKQRRCWSPELHKRFVDALQLLGGPQTATPKQIRELMKVDGLTNDEVKSHLQKYRLHIRKLPASLAGTVDYSWLTDERRGEDLSRRMVEHSGSPQDHLHGGGSAKGGSATGGDSMEEDEDEKSESHSWKGQLQRPVSDAKAQV